MSEPKTEFTDQLIGQLERIKTDSLLPLERRLFDTAIWFHRNAPRIPEENLKARLDFVSKTLDIVLELIALTCERMQRTETGRKQNLWTPVGAVFEDDSGKVHRFGSR